MDFARYRGDPVGYIEEVLGLELTEAQAQIASALAEHRFVSVRAGHGVGKTTVAAALVNWFYDCFDPCVVITTAPTKAQVVDVLWKEIRTQRIRACRRAGRPHDLLKKGPRIESDPKHVAMGLNARDSEAFQGRHEENILIVFDEAVGVDAPFWDGAKGMMTSPNARWLTIYNPTDVSSQAYAEERKGQFVQLCLSVMEHPNITHELAGKNPPFPAAVRLRWVEDRVVDWCESVPADSVTERDFEFPPGSRRWFRPDPGFEGRVLGRWPSQGDSLVWTEDLWNRCLQPSAAEGPVQIGCDVARYGMDWTSIVVRQGRAVLTHETHRGWDTVRTASRLRELATEFPGAVLAVDDDGVGGGVVDQLADLNVRAVRSGSRAVEPERYPNRRSELWFGTARLATEGLVDLSRLPDRAATLLRAQMLGVRWRLDSMGRRVVESKDDTKRRLKRSPDDADAFNLAFAQVEVPGAKQLEALMQRVRDNP